MGNALREKDGETPRTSELPEVKRIDGALPLIVELDSGGIFRGAFVEIESAEYKRSALRCFGYSQTSGRCKTAYSVA